MRDIPEFSFRSTPTFHQLWDACMERHLSAPEVLLKEIEGVFRRYNVRRSSTILDTSCGSGAFDIALMKRGFNLVTADGDAEMLKLFRKNQVVSSSVHEPVLAKWHDLPRVFPLRKFDALICGGNSFIYAGGHWNNDGEIGRKEALNKMLETLKTFRSLLVPGGILLVDKPLDDERRTEQWVASVRVAESAVYNVYFSVKLNAATRRCNAQILLRHERTGAEIGVPNVAYILKDVELIELLFWAGFSAFEILPRVSGQHFQTWVAKA